MGSTQGLHESFDRGDEPVGGSDRQFGYVFAVVFVLLIFLPVHLLDGVFGARPRWGMVPLAAAFGLVGWLRPSLLAPFNRVWTKLGLLLHMIVSPVILGLMFFTVILPVGLLLRATGWNGLRLGFDDGARSYWIHREPPGPPPESMTNQF